MRLRLALLVDVVVAVTLGWSAASAQAASGLLVELSAFSGTATYGVDLGAQSTTPILFSEQITWKLVGEARRRVTIGQTVTVPVRVTVRGAAHGQYAVIDQTGQTTSLVPYDCTSSMSHRPSGANRLTLALIRPQGLDAGAATCTDKEQARTLFFPTGSKWLASELAYYVLVSAPQPVSRITAQPKIEHGCGSTPSCVERLQFQSRVKLAVTR
jgi:hypothetical protein